MTYSGTGMGNPEDEPAPSCSTIERKVLQRREKKTHNHGDKCQTDTRAN